MEFMMFHVNCGTQLEYYMCLALTSLQINSANHTQTQCTPDAIEIYIQKHIYKNAWFTHKRHNIQITVRIL